MPAKSSRSTNQNCPFGRLSTQTRSVAKWFDALFHGRDSSTGIMDKRLKVEVPAGNSVFSIAQGPAMLHESDDRAVDGLGEVLHVHQPHSGHAPVQVQRFAQEGPSLAGGSMTTVLNRDRNMTSLHFRIWVSAHTDAWTRSVDSTLVDHLFSVIPPPLLNEPPA